MQFTEYKGAALYIVHVSIPPGHCSSKYGASSLKKRILGISENVQGGTLRHRLGGINICRQGVRACALQDACRSHSSLQVNKCRFLFRACLKSHHYSSFLSYGFGLVLLFVYAIISVIAFAIQQLALKFCYKTSQRIPLERLVHLRLSWTR